MENPSNNDPSTDVDAGGGGDSPPLATKVYFKGEKVVAYHGLRIYEAKAGINFLPSHFT
ncbi:protein MRG1 isoform X2 [Senna tora]|uniref:Protein MRG1 isoform X2 n=1 Tax=Senna tora TaxID=362788 RepID=A0A834W4Z7_9FABA|nr:protein MRG1 isoform X2 [Senna tora]